VRKASLFIIFLILLLAGGSYFFLTKKEQTKTNEKSISFRLLINKAHIVGRYNGKLQWELDAERTEKSSDERFTYLWGIKNGVFHDWERGKLWFEAKKAIYDNIMKNLQLEDVHIWSKELRVYAPVLLWEGDKQRIVCERGAKFYAKKASLTGEYLELDLKNSLLLVDNGVLKVRTTEKL
jgi:hypothetical protein